MAKHCLECQAQAALKLINVNVVEVAECKTNTGNTRKSNIEQEMQAVEKGCTNTDADSKIKQGTNSQSGQDNANKITNSFFSSPNVEANKRKSTELMWNAHNTFRDVFIGCFQGTFLLQLKPDSKPYQVPPRHVVYVLQKPFKGELEYLQRLDIITPLGVDEWMKWCNSFVLVPKANGKVRLCLDLARLNQALIRPIRRGPTLNDILPKLMV